MEKEERQSSMEVENATKLIVNTIPPVVVVRRVPLVWDRSNYFAITIDNAFTPQECRDLIARSESEGYEAALVNIGGRQQLRMDDVRNNDRCIIDDPSTAEFIWQRILGILEWQKSAGDEEEKGENAAVAAQKENDARDLRLHKLFSFAPGWHAVGLNERLRFLRYDPQTYFRPHLDGSFVRRDEAGEARRGEQSFVTCQLYLNDAVPRGGGETRFQSPEYCFSKEEEFRAIPRAGSVLLFQHRLLHEGCPVTAGRKYVIRTDVMYTDRGPEPEHRYSHTPVVL